MSKRVLLFIVGGFPRNAAECCNNDGVCANEEELHDGVVKEQKVDVVMREKHVQVTANKDNQEQLLRPSRQSLHLRFFG